MADEDLPDMFGDLPEINMSSDEESSSVPEYGSSAVAIVPTKITGPNYSTITGGTTRQPVSRNSISLIQHRARAHALEEDGLVTGGTTRPVSRNSTAGINLIQQLARARALEEEQQQAQNGLRASPHPFGMLQRNATFVDRPPTYDLCYVTSNPLVVGDGGQPVIKLNLEEEYEALQDVVKESRLEVKFLHQIATYSNLEDIMSKRTRVLHYSGHSQVRRVFFEADGTNIGEAALIDIDTLSGLCNAGGVNLVVCMSCQSEKIGEMFAQSVPHVIAINAKDTVKDSAAQIFLASFYKTLFNQRSIQSCFDMAVKAVLAKENNQKEAKKFLLLPKDGDHKSTNGAVPFEDLESGEPIIMTPPLSPTNLRAGAEIYIGREGTRMRVCQSVCAQRITVLKGHAGMGKNSLMEQVAHYLHERFMFSKGIYFIDCKAQVMKMKRQNNFTLALDDILYDVFQRSDRDGFHNLQGNTASEIILDWMKSLKIIARKPKNGFLLVLTNLDFLLLEEALWADDQALEGKEKTGIQNLKRASIDNSSFIGEGVGAKQIFENNWSFLSDLMEEIPGLRILTSQYYSSALVRYLTDNFPSYAPRPIRLLPMSPDELAKIFCASNRQFQGNQARLEEMFSRLDGNPRQVHDFHIKLVGKYTRIANQATIDDKLESEYNNFLESMPRDPVEYTIHSSNYQDKKALIKAYLDALDLSMHGLSMQSQSGSIMGSNYSPSFPRFGRFPSVPTAHSLRAQQAPHSFAGRSEPMLPSFELDTSLTDTRPIHNTPPRHLRDMRQGSAKMSSMQNLQMAAFSMQSNNITREQHSVSSSSPWHNFFKPLYDGAEFWAAYVNIETISFDDLMSNLNKYIIEKCKLTERGLFWNGSNRSDNECNELTKKELRLWFDHWLKAQVQWDQSVLSAYQQYKAHKIVHVRQFAYIWEKRLHALIPTIRHLGREWETRGAIAGFADKEQCLRRIAQGELWSFLVRFPMTRHHAVSVVLHDKKSGKGGKTKVRSIILNILESNEIFGSRRMNTNFQGCILSKKLFKFVYSWHHKNFIAKDKLFKERNLPPPTPLYNCCTFDNITKKMELNRRKVPLRNHWST